VRSEARRVSARPRKVGRLVMAVAVAVGMSPVLQPHPVLAQAVSPGAGIAPFVWFTVVDAFGQGVPLPGAPCNSYSASFGQGAAANATMVDQAGHAYTGLAGGAGAMGGPGMCASGGTGKIATSWDSSPGGPAGNSFQCDDLQGDYFLSAVAFNFSVTGNCTIDGYTSPVHMDGGGTLVPATPQTSPNGIQTGTQAFFGQLILMIGPNSGCNSFTWVDQMQAFGTTWAQGSLNDGWCWNGVASWASYQATCTATAIPPYTSDVVNCIPPTATDAKPSTHFQGTYSLACYCYPPYRMFSALTYEGHADGSTTGPTASK
jgi:hypothetical protein